MTRIIDLKEPSEGWWWGEPDEQDFGHRVPYIFWPEEDLLIKGPPGMYHDEVKHQATRMGYDARTDNSVNGSLFEHPENPSRVQHAVHSWTSLAKDPDVLRRLGEATGVSVSNETSAEAMLKELEGRDPNRAPQGWQLLGGVMEPEDEWWKVGCPNCGHDELDVHFHGGVSCPQCGWEGEMVGDTLLGMLPPTEEEADELWPDTLPWGDEEQDFYRHARVSPGAAQTAFEALRADGGFSMRPDGSPPPPGYYVAFDRTRLMQLSSVTPLAIQEYFNAHENEVRGMNGFYGGWVNGHGDVYLETSQSFPYLKEALEAAEGREEAIWDGYLDRELRVQDLLAERSADEAEAA